MQFNVAINNIFFTLSILLNVNSQSHIHGQGFLFPIGKGDVVRHNPPPCSEATSPFHKLLCNGYMPKLVKN